MSSSCVALENLLSFLFPSRFTSCESPESPGILLEDVIIREFNAFLWVSLITITALLIRKVFTILRLWNKANLIPGPPFPSFYGHCKIISREKILQMFYRIRTRNLDPR